MSYFLAFLSATLLSTILTVILRKIGLKFGFVSQPRERDVHKTPVPRIGGAAIYLAFITVTIFCFEVLFPDLSFAKERGWLGLDWHLLGILAGGTIIFFTMLFDDLRDLKAWQKLLIQIIVAFVVIGSGIGINSLPNPFGADINLNSVYIPLFTYNGVVYHFSLWSDLLTLAWLVVMMNVINFVDGIDGLASGLSVIASVTIFLLSISMAVSQPATAYISIILAGASFGFLIWNFPTAKIFMGDAGSMFLGFMLGILPLISGGKLATAFLVLGFPIIDIFFVAIGRLRKGKNPLTNPDKTHIHHRFLAAGFTTRETVLLLYLISIVLGWLALRSTTLEKLIAAVLVFVGMSALIFWLERRKKLFRAK
jgi:UDP-GlcNAc:undecaprenyl-phosphate GlcNAc-1-phosphate transferase